MRFPCLVLASLCFSARANRNWSFPTARVASKASIVLMSKKTNPSAPLLAFGERSAEPPRLIRYPSWTAWYDDDSAGRTATRVVPLVRNTSLPLFVVVGAAKAGTTFFRSVLNTHPMLTSGTGSNNQCGGETHFFDEHACRREAAPPADIAAEYATTAFSLPTCMVTRHLRTRASASMTSAMLYSFSTWWLLHRT